MAKTKKILTEEEELLSYNIMKNKNRQLILLEKKGLKAYQVTPKEIKQIKFFYNRFVFSILIFLVFYGIIPLGEALAAIIAIALYGIAELVYQFFIKAKFNPIKITQSEKDKFENSDEMMEFKRSTYVSRGIAGLLIGGVLVFTIITRTPTTLYNLVAAYLLSGGGILIGLYSLFQYFKISKWSKKGKSK